MIWQAHDLPDFLKANSFAHSKCCDYKFGAETCIINGIQTIETRKTLSSCDKYVAQLCDRMIAAFRNSVTPIPPLGFLPKCKAHFGKHKKKP